MTIPTRPGIYAADRYPLGTSTFYMPYVLTADGEWYEMGEPGSGFENIPLDRKQVEELGTLRPIITGEYDD